MCITAIMTPVKLLSPETNMKTVDNLDVIFPDI